MARKSGVRARHLATALALVAVLAGCDGGLPWRHSSAPRSSPFPRPAPATPEVVAPRSAESLAVQAYYQQVQDTLKARGLLRQDVAPHDAPFGTRQLVDNFIHVALYDEYSAMGGTYVARSTTSRLRRWEVPVRMSVEFGASVPLAQRDADRAMITGFAARLGAISRHPLRMVPRDGNFAVLVVNEDERRALGPRLA